MEHIDRRAALAFGFATAVAFPALLTPTPASAQRYRPDEGREIAPGVRRIDLTKRASEIPAYATVSTSRARSPRTLPWRTTWCAIAWKASCRSAKGRASSLSRRPGTCGRA
jgi:hypothetical protein